MTPIVALDACPSIVIIDNFLSNPHEWRQFALQQTFLADERYFKGRRTRERWLPEAFKIAMEKALGRSIGAWESNGVNGVFQICVAGTPVVYHSDSQAYAAMLYLTPDAPPQSGTATYRSARYKWRKAPTEAEAKAENMNCNFAQAAMYGCKLLDPTAWEEIDRAGNVFNRLVILDSRNVHSALNYFGTDLHTGRLFQIFFFDVLS